jgi:hypothetical protein
MAIDHDKLQDFLGMFVGDLGATVAPATRVGTFAPFGLLEQGQETARQFLAQVADAGIDYVCCGDHVSFFGASDVARPCRRLPAAAAPSRAGGPPAR